MSIPLFLVGFTMLWVLMLASLVPIEFVLVFGIVCLILILVLRTRDLTVLVVLVAAVLACALFCLKTYFYYEPCMRNVGSYCEVSGKVIKVSSDERYVIKVSAGPLSGYKLRLTSKYYSCSLGDTVSFRGKIYEVDEKSKDIYVGAYPSGELEIVSSGSGGLGITDYFEEELKAFLPSDYALLLKAMLIGEKSELPDEIYDSFRSVGIVHILAVSGFHISLWSMMLYRFLLKNGVARKASSCLCIVFILAFLALTGFSKSTIRASLMLIIFFLGRMFKRQVDSRNSLGAAAIIILTINPFAGGDVGFLLSFFATLGILVMFPKMQGFVRPFLKAHIGNFYLRKHVDNLLGLVFVSVSSLVFTLPVVMIYIGDISLISPLSNLLISSAASLAIFLSGIAVILSVIPLACAFENPLLLVSGLIARYMVELSSLLEKIPYSYVDISGNGFMVLVAAIIIYLGFHIILCY